MTILDKIIAHKKKEVAQLRQEVLVEKLIKSPNFKRTPISLKKALLSKNSNGIIAEYKRQSPSKGIINDVAEIVDVTQGYLEANVAAQSILTDSEFFGGNIMDVIKARSVNENIPILRKDFIVDGFQIVEAKAIGADAILLIVACLSDLQLSEFTALAHELKLDVLVEVHDLEELERALKLPTRLVGINNRNLRTFETTLNKDQQKYFLAQLRPWLRDMFSVEEKFRKR